MVYQLLFSNPVEFFIIALALVISLTIHEFAHAWTANRLGDPTAKLAGRVTLNPLAHLDPLGTLAILFIGLGWGKPVIFDPYNLRNPRKDAAIIALAGPGSNLLLAILFAVLIRLLPMPTLFVEAFIAVISINVSLAIFNLIPIHPLDGGKILIGLIPPTLAREWDTLLHQYGTLILIFLIFPFNGRSAISSLIGPIISTILKVLL